MDKVLIYGDLHLSSKKVGYHKDYANHSLKNLGYIKDILEQECCSNIIGLGDFADGVFSLNYRLGVDSILKGISDYTGGKHYTLKGNHDISTSGLTEFDYYTSKGLIKMVDRLELNNCVIYFANYGCIGDIKVDKVEGKKNILICHDYIVFKDSKNINEYYKPIYYEDYTNLEGLDLIICGHIHGKVRYTKNNLHIIYPGSSSMGSIDSDTTCYFIVLECSDTGYKLKFKEYSLNKEDIYDLDKYKLDCDKKGLTDSVKDSIKDVLDLGSLITYSLDATNYRNLIDNLKGVSKDVKSCAIDLLDKASS